MSQTPRRRGCALAIIASALALLAFAPGAFAASLSVDGSGNLVYAGSAGKVSAVEFDETGTGVVTVHEVTQGGSMDLGFQTFTGTDNDTITAGTGCTAGALDANNNPTFVCTGVTGSIQASTADLDDLLDGSGQLAGVSGVGLATIPLVADLGTDNDAAIGGRADDTIHGGDGDDNIGGDTGGPGAGSNDTLFGDAGIDGLAGGSGNDSLDGGTGDDAGLVGGPGADTISGGDGNDQFVAGGPGDDVVSGGAGDDSIYGDCNGGCGLGTDGNDTLNGDAGNDYINGEGGNDTIHGGDGDDDVEGDYSNTQNGADTVFGDAGDDYLRTKGGDDVVDGGDGNDNVYTGKGNDIANGGAGNDDVWGATGNDQVNGGAGDDYVTGDCGGYNDCGDGPDGTDTVTGGSGNDYTDGDGGTDKIDLGSGFDTIAYENRIRTAFNDSTLLSHPVSVTLDGVANDGGAGENDSILGIEDVQITNRCCSDTPAPGGATITGDAGTNSLMGADGNDIIDGGAGNDFLYGNNGDDTINANDGFADRVSCGAGTDVANVDEFDAVDDSCETVNRTTRGNLATEDAPPTVAFTAPASGAKMSTKTANTLSVNATDDKGITQVIFLANERVICVVKTAPYNCSYKPTDADVGRTAITAVAYDTSQQTASAIRSVTVPRFTVKSISFKTTPGKDTTAPYTFKTSGRINLPTGVTKANGCKGDAIVTFKAGKKTISSRRAKLSKSCAFSKKVTFSIPSRLHPKTLRVHVAFRGNAVLSPKGSKTKTVKVA